VATVESTPHGRSHCPVLSARAEGKVSIPVRSLSYSSLYAWLLEREEAEARHSMPHSPIAFAVHGQPGQHRRESGIRFGSQMITWRIMEVESTSWVENLAVKVGVRA
jgi:hypothetical protein